MNPLISQRLGYVFGLAMTLPQEQIDYILDEAQKAPDFESLPLDIQLWISDAESKTAVHPGARQAALAEELSIDKEMP